MHTTKRTTASQQSVSEVQLARLQLEKAEGQLKSAKEQARLARRRRKEAKQAARRAKKQARLARQEFAEAKLALAEAEAKLVRSQKRTVTAQSRKASARKATVAPQKKRLVLTAVSLIEQSANPKIRKRVTEKRAAKARTGVRKTEQPIAVLESTTATASTPVREELVQTGQSTGESQTGKTETGRMPEPAAPDTQTR